MSHQLQKMTWPLPPPKKRKKDLQCGHCYVFGQPQSGFRPALWTLQSQSNICHSLIRKVTAAPVQTYRCRYEDVWRLHVRKVTFIILLLRAIFIHVLPASRCFVCVWLLCSLSILKRLIFNSYQLFTEKIQDITVQRSGGPVCCLSYRECPG